jgi:predicted Holliday junction resolvase-like endonuclease
MHRRFLLFILAALTVTLPSCRSIIYTAYEKVGIHKRDLLKKRVAAAREEQVGAQEEFKDALTRLKEMTAFDGGALEKQYRSLQSDYDDAAARVAAVHQRIDAVETVASDLFAEWKKESKQIESDALRQTSRRQLEETKLRYDTMLAALKRSEKSMDPVLRKLNDYVLSLKHTLNAAAIASLSGESARIQSDVTRLIADMDAAIARADEFIKQMPSS